MADSLLPQDSSNESNLRDEILNKWKDKSKEDLLEAKINSDIMIMSQNARLDDIRNEYLGLREQATASAQLKDLIEQLRQERQPNEPNPDNLGTPVQPGIKTEDIEEIVSRKLTDHQVSLKQQDNFNAMQAKLKQTYGENYGSVYKQRLETLGLTPEFADDLARKHPSVFIKTMELEDRQPSVSNNLPRSSQRPTSFAPKSQVRDWNYYQELKKTNPRLYLDPKISVQMVQDLEELGDRFGLPTD